MYRCSILAYYVVPRSKQQKILALAALQYRHFSGHLSGQAHKLGAATGKRELTSNGGGAVLLADFLSHTCTFKKTCLN